MDGVYPGLRFADAPADRPYVVINMVATIDGKTVTGGRDEAVADLGSDVDHATMRQIEAAADAVLIGAGSLRATKGLWYPARLKRYVATRGGDLDYGSRFFTDAPGSAWVVGPRDSVPNQVQCLDTTGQETCWSNALRTIRREHGVMSIVVEGGSELNAALLHENLVDELFLTLAPKIKLGRSTPTYAGGDPLSREQVQRYRLVSCLPVQDEVFLRYAQRGDA
ncbi:MAG: RibD family protein [Armatimonadetes bacterium]|nr:RibD family protein [Armatimonadota bacterium]